MLFTTILNHMQKFKSFVFQRSSGPMPKRPRSTFLWRPEPIVDQYAASADGGATVDIPRQDFARIGQRLVFRGSLGASDEFGDHPASGVIRWWYHSPSIAINAVLTVSNLDSLGLPKLS